MRIAVTTPTGHVGHYLASMLVSAGVRPLLLTRHPDRIPDELRAYADIAEADSTDGAEIADATEDVDAMYWVDPSTVSADPLGDYARATEALVKAVVTNRIPRIVFQSSVGAERRHGVGEIDGLAGTEVALDGLDADVTILRCGYFFTNLLLDLDAVRAGVLRTVHDPDHAMAWVAPRDIAEVAALTLLNPEWSGHRIQAVHGPEDLSWNRVAELLSEQVGHAVRAERIGDERMRQQYLDAGMPPAMADAVLGMSTGLRDGFEPEQARTPVTTTPTGLAGWIREELLPAL